MSRAAREWVRDLGEDWLRDQDHGTNRLCGAARGLLWAVADRANDAGEFWPSERRMVAESGVSYAQVKRLLPLLVKTGVIEKLKPHAGTRPAVYRFTFIDPAGLPSALTRSALVLRSSTAVHDASSANTGADLVIWGAETVPVLRNVALGDPSLVRSFDGLVRSSGAASALTMSAEPEEPENHLLQVGGSGSGESSDAPAPSQSSGASLAQGSDDNPSGLERDRDARRAAIAEALRRPPVGATVRDRALYRAGLEQRARLLGVEIPPPTRPSPEPDP